jgi:alkylation response protein AidB-like acyl-CoA dehydrogenase
MSSQSRTSSHEVPAELVALARDLAKARYAPQAHEWDRDRIAFPHEERRFLGSLGLLGICLPERFGGSGAPLTHALSVIEELAKESLSAAFQVFEANTGPARALSLLGSDELQSRYLPAIIRGETTMAIAISEPDAGSSMTDMVTRATPEAGMYRLTGTKRWISNGGEADSYLVYARFGSQPGSRGVGAIVVDADTSGVSFGAREQLMGFRCIPSADVILDDALVPELNLVVPAGEFRRLFGAFSIERLGNSTMSLAIGQAALDRSVAYVQDRIQFGKPLIEFQSVQLTIAEMLMRVEGVRLLIRRAAEAAGDGLPDTLQVSLAKCAANEMAKSVSDLAMQLHGGNGYTEEYGIERLHRDAHGWALAGGTPAIQRIRIVSELLGRTFDQRR